jgi:Tol biopolymer transport system component
MNPRHCFMKTCHWFILLFWLVTATRAGGQGPVHLTGKALRSVSKSTSDGITGAGASGAAVFSGDGRFVFFLSDAGNLVLDGPVNGFADLFRHDLVTGTMSRVMAGDDRMPWPNGPVTGFSVSANGRWVAFSSRATNLTPGDTNGVEDIFLRDVEIGVTRLVSHGDDGAPANAESVMPLLSVDGRWVAFESAATNLTRTGDTNRNYDVFLWDRDTDRIEPISRGLDGNAARGRSSLEALSRLGETIVFRSSATNLVGVATEMETDLYVWSRHSGRLRRILLSGARPSDLVVPVTAINSALSFNGRFLTFRTRPTLGDVGPGDGVWWVDLEMGSTAVRISGDLVTTRPVGSMDASGPVISEDGQWVAFEAHTPASGPPRIRIWKSGEGLKSLDDWNSGGQLQHPEPESSWSPLLSPDGKELLFQTDAAVPAAGVRSSGEVRFYVRNLASAETRTLFPELALELPLSSPAFSSSGTSVLFQTAAVLPGVSDFNRANDVYWAPVTLERMELISRRHPERPIGMGMGGSWIRSGSLSEDGRWLAFTSSADNLVSNDANGRRDVFVHDIIAGTNQLVSVGLDGRSPQADSWQPRISGDGRYVVFVSMATNLAGGNHPSQRAVYVRDLVTATTVLASARDGGSTGGSHAAFNPQISSSGARVTFESTSTNLVQGAWGRTNRLKLFVRSLSTQRTYLASDSLRNSGTEESRDSFSASLDHGADRVVFLSGSDVYEYSISNGIPRQVATGHGATTVSLSRDGSRIALLGRQTGTHGGTLRTVMWGEINARTLRLIASATNSSPTSLDNVSISSSGQFVAFDSIHSPPGINDTNGVQDVFLFDTVSGVLERASAGGVGHEEADGNSDRPVLSADGQRLAFRRITTNRTGGQSGNMTDIYVRDRRAGMVSLLSPRSTTFHGERLFASNPWISADGRVVAFQSRSADFHGGDYNNTVDTFVSSVPPMRPVLAALTLAGNDELHFQIIGTAGTVVIIEFSRDLLGWQRLSRHTLPDKLQVPIATELSPRFYRALIEE